MPPFTHRAPGVVGAAFDYPDVKAELICDGVHIHPTVVRAVFKLFGSDRVILISDSLRATGMPDGRYPFGGQEIEVHGNRATMADDPNTLAGSVSDLMACPEDGGVLRGAPGRRGDRRGGEPGPRCWASTTAWAAWTWARRPTPPSWTSIWT